MDSRDIFRRFFGFPNRLRHPTAADLGENDDGGHDRDDGFSFFFGDSNHGLDGMFERFHGDMFRQMEALHTQMEDLMKGFGAIDFPSSFDQPQLRPFDPDGQGKPEPRGRIFSWSSVPSPFFRHSEKTNPRDFMLKDGIEDDFRADTPALPAPPVDDDKPKTDSAPRVPRWTVPATLYKKDTDLDGKISEDKLLELIKHPDRQPPVEAQPSPGSPGIFSSRRKTISVSTFRGPDNKVEHKKTVRNSSGEEESTVTRSIGDKSYSVTMITEKDGTQKTHKTFKNMDESEMSKFEEEWNRKRQPQLISPDDNLNTDDKNIFSKLFK